MSGGAGWSGPNLERAQLVLDDLENPLPEPRIKFEKAFAWGVEGAKGGSPNHEAEAWGNEAARAAVHGTREEFERAAAVLLDAYYPRELAYGQKAIGIGANEVLTPDNHSHQHLCGVSMGRIAAVRSGHPELLRRSGELLRAWSSLLQAVATPAPYYFVCSAGYRSPGKPVWWQATAWLRQLMGVPGPMPEFERNPRLWRDRASAAVRALRYLQHPRDLETEESLDDLAGAAKVGPAGVKLKHEVLVYRKDGDRHLVIIPRPEHGAPGKEVCDWVEVPHGLKTFKLTMAGVRYGLNWQDPPPKPPRGARLIRFPATWD